MVAFNAYQLPLYKSKIFLLPLLIYIDSYLLYTFTNKFNCSKLKLIFALGIIFISTLTIFVFLIGLFFDFKSWNPVSIYLSLGILSVSYVPKVIAFIIILPTNVIDYLRFNRLIIRKVFNNVIGIAALLIFLIMAYGMFITPNKSIVSRKEALIKNLPGSFNDLRIVHISDLHLGSWLSTKQIKNMVEEVNSLNPDLVFITGDIVNFHSNEIDRFDNILPLIEANYGIYSILGNHDYGEYVIWESKSAKEANLDRLIKSMRSYGWNVLLNESIVLKIEDEEIIIAGVENWGEKSRFPKKGDIEKTLENVDTAKTILLLSHDPSYWQNVISKDYKYIDMTFSGHTHGMQLGLNNQSSLANMLLTYGGGFFEKKDKEQSPTYLNVNNGYGFIAYPGRIGVNPEISLIILKSMPE
jgi:uncharacterized protein